MSSSFVVVVVVGLLVCLRFMFTFNTHMNKPYKQNGKLCRPTGTNPKPGPNEHVVSLFYVLLLLLFYLLYYFTIYVFII